MKTKNAMQLKAMIKKIAIEKNISPQLAMQNYMLERILARIEKSSYRENFIVKGGFLIGAMVGIDSRTTMDLDTTITGFNLSKETLHKIFVELSSVDVDDDIEFSIEDISEIREGDEYPELRVSLKANYEKMRVPLTIDVTTGDIITPAAIVSSIPTMFNEGKLNVYSYNIETIFSEKLETILSRAEANTRPRDFYDVYLLYRLRANECDIEVLKHALERTTGKRGSSHILLQWESIIEKIEDSEFLRNNWHRYCNTNAFADGISFKQICETVKMLMEAVSNQRK